VRQLLHDGGMARTSTDPRIFVPAHGGVSSARQLLADVVQPAWDRGGRKAVAEKLSELAGIIDPCSACRQAVALLGLDREGGQGDAEFARLCGVLKARS
jgi:hypothetical protein